MKTWSHCALLLIGLVGAACTPDHDAPTTLNYGLTLAPTGIDPHLNASAELGIPLRDGVLLHGGTPVDAGDVAANLDFVFDPDHHSQKAIFMLGPFERAEVIDARTVALHLRSE